MALVISLRDPVDLVPLTFILFSRSCRSWIFKVCSVVRSWGSRILRILDPRFLFHRGILEILDLEFLVMKWDPGDPGSYIFALSWDPGDLGSWLSDLAVGSCRSWILKSYFVVGSCRSWIPIFGCGTCLPSRSFVTVPMHSKTGMTTTFSGISDNHDRLHPRLARIENILVYHPFGYNQKWN